MEDVTAAGKKSWEAMEGEEDARNILVEAEELFEKLECDKLPFILKIIRKLKNPYIP